MSGVVEKVKAKVEQVLHKDTTHNTHSTATGHSATSHGNTHTSGFGTGGSHPQSTTAGPHDSNLANKLDPRVDSDRDGANVGQYGHSSTHQGGLGGAGTAQQGYGNTHSSGGLGGIGNTHQGHTHGSTNAGPHDSNIANKLDPRVDSDRDGANVGQYGHNTTHQGGLGGVGSAQPGYGNNHSSGGLGGQGQNYNSSNSGPHDSNLANKLDPRVDSDNDGQHPGQNQAQAYSQGQAYGSTGGVGGVGGGHLGQTGGIGGSHHPHQQEGYGQGLSGNQGEYGSANTTSGPHSSNLANKLDPRVDSQQAPGGPTY